MGSPHSGPAWQAYSNPVMIASSADFRNCFGFAVEIEPECFGFHQSKAPCSRSSIYRIFSRSLPLRHDLHPEAAALIGTFCQRHCTVLLNALHVDNPRRRYGDIDFAVTFELVEGYFQVQLTHSAKEELASCLVCGLLVGVLGRCSSSP